MKSTLIIVGTLVLTCLSLFGSQRDPSNFYYRISPPGAPLKLEPVYYAPRPTYPDLARRQRLEGSGIAQIHINPDGSVASVDMLKSTDHKILDDAAIHGFLGWRFRPHSVNVVRVAIQYRMRLSSVRWGSRADLKNIGDGDGVVIVARHS
jgi:TonB family protein